MTSNKHERSRPPRAARAALRARRRTAIAVVTLAALLGAGLAAGAAALDRGQGGTPAEAAATRAGDGTATAIAPSGTPELATSTTRSAPRRAADVPKSTTTTAKPTTTTRRKAAPPSAPPADGFPGPGNTGIPSGVALKASGSVTVSRAGAVIDRLDIDGCLTIAASDVTVRRTRIRCGQEYPVRIANGAKRAVLEDVEIDGLGSAGATAIGTDNYTLRRADVHSVGDGPRVSNNTVVQDSWIHDLAVGGGSHNDGIQATGGSNIRILHNRIEHPGEQTSCILIGADLDNISDVLVQGNLLNGGNYAVYAGSESPYRADNVRIVGNRFGRGAVYGTHKIQSNITFSGNVWHDTGKPIGR